MPLFIQRASAGSGKTEQLARRYLQILLGKDAMGHQVDPSTILGATFTREAAGEILARILKILSTACQEKVACQQMVEGTNIPAPSIMQCQGLLKLLMEQIDRLRIGTIDALFAQQARSFVLDLGLAPHWEIADSFTSSHLAQQTLLELMKRSPCFADHWKTLHHFKRPLFFLKSAARLLETHRSLAHLQLLEEVPEKKSPPLVLTSKEEREMEAFFSSFKIPLTAQEKPNGHWVAALKKIKQALVRPIYLRDFIELSPLFSQLLEREPRFYGKPIPSTFLSFFTPLVQASCAEVHRLALLQEGAFLQLIQDYHELRGQYSFQQGGYTFWEIEEIVSRASAQFSKEEIEFRMDMRTGHLLLDEYQDTSERQHAFLLPLIGDVLAKGGCAFVVGDMKQGIYGWRGGKRHLLSLLEKTYQHYLANTRPLHQSYRSSPAILAAVNHVFGALKNQEMIERMQAGEAFATAAARWSLEFQPQESAGSASLLQGAVHLHQVSVSKGEVQETIMEKVIEKVVHLVEVHRRADPLRDIAILVRRTKFIPSLLMRLREKGIHASGEGGNPLADTLAVEVLLSLLSWLDHPGNSAAYEHVRSSPLGELLREQGALALTQGAALRVMLVDHGYARSLRAWMSRPAFQNACSNYERERLEQLIAMAWRFDAMGGGAPSELVKRAREERIGNRLSLGVRVLSIHASKGLEFQSVILMDLDTSIFGEGYRGLCIQRTDDGRFFIQNNREKSRAILHQAREKKEEQADREHVQQILHEEQWEEALSLLYVAMTRAICYLDIVIEEEEEGVISKKSMGAWLRVSELPPVFNHNGLSLQAERKKSVAIHVASTDQRPSFTMMSLKRSPSLIKRSPSKEIERGMIELSQKFHNHQALAHGIAQHAFLAQIEWSKDMRLLEKLTEQHNHEELQAVFHEGHFFSKWKKQGIIRLEVWRERRFAVVIKRSLLIGTFDRVVIGLSDHPVIAQIIDFKTTPARVEEKELHYNRYQIQLDQYCKALQHLLPSLKEIEKTIVWI